ncbi:MAG: endonuclease/exonuclease/phosphatase family protein [Thalassobaculaceae bacterium]
MRLLTWNTWKNSAPYEERLALMTDAIAAADPDIVLLQEVFVGGGMDTAAHIARGLGLSVTAAPARSKPRRHGDGSVESTNGLAILSRRPVDAQRVIALPTHPDDPDRIAQVARIGAVTVVNLHLTHLEGADALRRGQVVHLLDRLSAGTPTVIGGDLNAEPDAPALRKLGEAGFRDLAEAAPFATAGGRRIDFLLCRDMRDEGAAAAAEPVGKTTDVGTAVGASDHVGILVELPGA